ncbi:hypothetical protein DQ397_004212 [Pseudomonas sp. CK-NBRI-02]|uniref:hypothetical protein n=1 Tax=Pseudomonas sp. CK-NBRI-02 TaxID=2249759 RepID=UPI0005B9EC9C|nr:hypothetical protein [Pseudomonas sp. CK-NBRI-02]TYO70631.1 hypothetical protein DQ397_004212 [Pseudomonas sp. CK-NBRI-02]
MTDWNWFFSTLSQSAAAITGIFGAFIITKIFSNQTSFHEKSKALRQLIADGRKIKLDAKACNINWYNTTINSAALDEAEIFLSNHCHELDPSEFQKRDELMRELKFSKFSDESLINEKIESMIVQRCQKNKEEIEREIAVREEAKRKKEEFEKRSLEGKLTLGDALRRQAPIGLAHSHFQQNMASIRDKQPTIIVPNILPWPELNKVASNYMAIYTKAKHNSILAADLVESISQSPDSRTQIAASLILVSLIFFAGVIYPLSFMPLSGAPELEYSFSAVSRILFSLKGALLTTLSAAFLAVISVFFVANMRLKHDDNDITEATTLSKIEAYSKNFKYIDNRAE